MNPTQFQQYLKNPGLLNKQSLAELEELIKSYPYASDFRTLYALNLLILNDYRYQKNLVEAAFYAADRKKLKEWVDFIQHDDEILKNELVEETAEISQPIALEPLTEKPVSSAETMDAADSAKLQEKDDAQIIPEKEEKESIPIDKSVSASNIAEMPQNVRKEKTVVTEKPETRETTSAGNTIKTKAELLAMVKRRLAEISSQKVEETPEEVEIRDALNEDKSIRAQLIDRFIAIEPRISSPDKSDQDGSETESGEDGLMDDDFFVTETLAQIYQQQGNIQRAIEIYRKLILKNPEKSSYFAARIQEVSIKEKK
jgi:tetratricopeptide (TPR) repeat protein